MYILSLLRLFQSTRPRGARPVTATSKAPPSRFQSTRPRGARLHIRQSLRPAGRFQSTRPRGARPQTQILNILDRLISIHAPAWGATGLCVRSCRSDKISIHAPAWGATEQIGISGIDVLISIHAPAWGATFHHLRVRTRLLISIHAPAWGATFFCIGASSRRRDFNPRARVGRDGSFTSFWNVKDYFNPRARVGRDHERVDVRTCQAISIHAPAWGATGHMRTMSAATSFQSTRPRGARLDCVSVPAVVMRFQSTRPRGARHDVRGGR